MDRMSISSPNLSVCFAFFFLFIPKSDKICRLIIGGKVFCYLYIVIM